MLLPQTGQQRAQQTCVRQAEYNYVVPEEEADSIAWPLVLQKRLRPGPRAEKG